MMVSQKTSNSITRPYVSSNKRQATINEIGEVNVPSVLANLVRLWTDNTSWNLTHHHLSRASRPRWSCPSFIKDGRVHHGTTRPTQVTSIAVMEVTPNSPNSSTLGTVTKQITVPHILYKDSSMKGKGIQTISFFERIPESSRVTNFIIGGFLAGPL